MSAADALFQLGMDLAPGSSTAQTEAQDHDPHGDAPHEERPLDERKDYFVERNGARYAGTHLLIDLWGAERLDDIEFVRRTLVDCVEAAGASLLHIHLHHFTPNQGVSGVAVLAESHISIHSWPETGYAALDVFMCGGAEPHKAVEVLRQNFKPATVSVEEVMRGPQR